MLLKLTCTFIIIFKRIPSLNLHVTDFIKVLCEKNCGAGIKLKTRRLDRYNKVQRFLYSINCNNFIMLYYNSIRSYLSYCSFLIKVI